MNAEPPSKIEAKELHEKLYSVFREELDFIDKNKKAGGFKNSYEARTFNGRYFNGNRIIALYLLEDDRSIVQMRVDFGGYYLKLEFFDEQSLLFLAEYGGEIKQCLNTFVNSIKYENEKAYNDEEEHWKSVLKKASDKELDKV